MTPSNNLPTTGPVGCIGAEPSRGGGAEQARMESGCSVPNLPDCPIANYGWRRLGSGEVVSAGDEYWTHLQTWMLVFATVGNRIGQGWISRRRITPPDGYEIVALDDLLPSPCKAYRADGQIVNVSGLGVGRPRDWLPRRNFHAFFRPIAKDGDGWVKLLDGNPVEGQIVEVTDGQLVTISTGRYCDGKPMGDGWTVPRDKEITHWKPLKLSPPPKPEKPAEEIAFDKWKDSTGCDPFPTLRSCWLAALEFARKEKV